MQTMSDLAEIMRLQVSYPSPAAPRRPCARLTTNKAQICSAERGASQKPTTSNAAGVGERMPYNYTSSDGKRKATLEDAFVQSREASGAGQIEHNTGMAGSQPWAMGWQMSERHLMWNDDLAARLLKARQNPISARKAILSRQHQPHFLQVATIKLGTYLCWSSRSMRLQKPKKPLLEEHCT